MAPPFITALIYYDGELVVDGQQNGSYVGGFCKPGRVRRGCTLGALKDTVFQATRINPLEYDIELSVNWPTESGSRAVTLSDDEDVQVLFSTFKKSFELFVGKTAKEIVEDVVEEIITPPIVSSGFGCFTEMLQTHDPSLIFSSPLYTNPYFPPNVDVQ